VCRFLRRRVDGLEVGVWRVCGVVGRFVSGRGRERGSGGEFSSSLFVEIFTRLTGFYRRERES